MRYLRVLCNSMAAAALGTAYVLVLFLHLNPSLPLQPTRLMPLVTTVGLFYVIHLTVLFYVLLVLRQLADHLHSDVRPVARAGMLRLEEAVWEPMPRPGSGPGRTSAGRASA